jgi:hypothetical protein
MININRMIQKRKKIVLILFVVVFLIVPTILLSINSIPVKRFFYKFTNNDNWQNKYECVSEIKDGLAIAKKKGQNNNTKFVLVDSTGFVLVDGEYLKYYEPEQGTIRVTGANGKFGLINYSGKLIVPCEYDRISSYCDGLVSFERNGKSGYFNLKGKEVVPAKYDRAFNFWYSVSIVENDNKFGLMDTTGTLILSLEYDQINILGYRKNEIDSALFYILTINNKKGIYDPLKRKIIIPLKYDNISIISGSQFSVELNNKWGVVDKNGKILSLGIYDDIGYSRENDLINVKLNNKWGYINSENKIVIPFIYEEATTFKNSIAAVKKNGYWGFIDIKGNEVIPFKFSCMQRNYINGGETISMEKPPEFFEGLAAIEKNNKWGFINEHGEVLINYQFDRIIDGFLQERAVVMKDGFYGLIDKKGAAITGFIFTGFGYRYPDGGAMVTTGNIINDYLRIDKNGNFINDTKGACKWLKL